MMNIAVLSGGVGGAKLADGLAQILPPEQLTIIGNTGDDFQHLGLTICPDLDTVMYTLAGVANPETGWGRVNESWQTMNAIAELGGPDWFRLGDLDLATHLFRNQWLTEGISLTEITSRLGERLGMHHTVLPMSDEPAPTMIETETGRLPFQTWFVKERWQPTVKAIHLPNDVKATPQVIRALDKADLILIAPSNPFVSIDPILNVYPIRPILSDRPDVAVIAVSPIIAGRAVKGPAAKLLRELNMPVTPQAIATYYDDILDAFVYDVRDEGALSAVDMPTLCVDTWMKSVADRRRLAQAVLNFATELIS